MSEQPPPPPPGGYPPPPPPSGGYPPPPPPSGGYQAPPPPPSGGYPAPPPPSGGYQAPPQGYQPQMGYGAPMQPYAPAANYGGFWIRVVAYIIDAIILGIVGGILDVIFRVNPNDTTGSGSSISGLISLVLGILYFAGLWTYWGQTLGQKLFKLRIVDANTMQPIGFGKAILRYVGLVISFLVCFIGVIWVAFDARKQGWMDKIAGTVVLQG